MVVAELAVPTTIQKALARSEWISAWAGIAIVSGFVAWKGLEIVSVYLSLWIVALVIASVLASIPLGIIFGGFIFGLPLTLVSETVNGAPFREGEFVHILVGPHRGTVAEVYEVWAVRNQVRLRLGEKAKAEVKDVFHTSQVCREKRDQQLQD